VIARVLAIIAGRGGGKTFMAILMLVYYAICRRYVTAPGERIYAGIFAPTRQQARLAFNYVLGLLRSWPELEVFIESVTADEIRLTNGVSIVVSTADHRTLRGRSFCIVVVDETAFLPADDSATPDKELLRAIMPALGRVPGSILVLASSPWARRGVLYDAWKKHFGVDGDSTLVVRGSTLALNPTFDRATIDAAFADDPISAATEYGGEWRSDAEALLTEAAIASCVVPGRLELPRQANVTYFKYFDMAGGSGADSAAACVGHREGDTIVIDAIRERRPPFSPEECCREFADLCRAYGVSTAVSDRWGGQFPVEQMAKLGITVTPSEKTASDLFRDLVATVNSARIELPEHARLLAQLGTLERRAGSSGRESISHGPGGHDDIANAVAGVASLALNRGVEVRAWRPYVPAARVKGSLF
jgi:hypothetical protein